MPAEAKKDKLKAFYQDLCISLAFSIRAFSFYTPDHPICEYSLNNFKSTLDEYFLDKDMIEIGIFQFQIY